MHNHSPSVTSSDLKPGQQSRSYHKFSYLCLFRLRKRLKSTTTAALTIGITPTLRRVLGRARYRRSREAGIFAGFRSIRRLECRPARSSTAPGSFTTQGSVSMFLLTKPCGPSTALATNCRISCPFPPASSPAGTTLFTAADSAERTRSWAISFGMPSKEPSVWRADVEKARKGLAPARCLSSRWSPARKKIRLSTRLRRILPNAPTGQRKQARRSSRRISRARMSAQAKASSTHRRRLRGSFLKPSAKPSETPRSCSRSGYLEKKSKRTPSLALFPVRLTL